MKDWHKLSPELCKKRQFYLTRSDIWVLRVLSVDQVSFHAALFARLLVGCVGGA